MQLTPTMPALLQVAIGLRSVSRGYIPDKAFIVVSLAVTAFMLIGWRAGLAALTKVCLVTLCNMIIDNLHSHSKTVLKGLWSCSDSFKHAAMKILNYKISSKPL